MNRDTITPVSAVATGIRSRLLGLSAGCCLLCLATTARAFTFTETTDAANSPTTATVLPFGTTQVDGTIQLPDRTGADLFAFTLPAPTTMTIQMTSNDFDANLLLYNGFGQGLAGDDDDNSGCANAPPNSLDSCLTLSLEAGSYFVAAGENNIGSFESEADFLAAVIDFMDNDFGILGAPTTEILGFAGFESGLSDPDPGGAYTMTFSEAVVPEPGTLCLLGSVVGLGLVRRRRT